jgi:hypothetical protein
VTKIIVWAQPPNNSTRNALSTFALRSDSVVVGLSLWTMLLVALISFGAPALAQQSVDEGQDPANSSIQGVVTAVSPSGESTPLEGVTLKLSFGATQQRFITAVTDTEGHYQFDHLCESTYELQIQLTGFEPFDKTFLLRRDEVHVENVVLHIAVVTQRVEVHDQASQVTTEGATPAAKLSDQQFQALPMTEQKFKAVLPLVPGVVRARDGTLNIKGQAENQGMLLVDSAQTVDPVTGSFSIPIPLDAVQEVHVKKAPYDSEYGGFSGGLTAISTKAPSDSWHYRLMDFIPGIRGKAGHIVGISSETPRLFFGGPLLRNKLAFSEAFTYDFLNKPVRGLAWPHNETRTEGFASLTSFQAVLSPRHLLSVNVSGFSKRTRYADINSLVPQPASSDDGQRGVSFGTNDSYQFGSGGVVNTTFQYTRFDSNAHGQGREDMLVTPEGWGGNFFSAWTRTSNQYEFLSLYQFPQMMRLGSHALKVGVDLTHRSFDGNTSSHPIQLLRQDGSVAELINFQGGGALEAQDTEVSEFVQDHWSVNSHLALDMGVRLVSQSLGRSAAFAPRVGLAYSPGEGRKTIVRAGIGLFYDRVPMLAADFADNPARVVTSFDGGGLPVGPAITFQGVCLGNGKGASLLHTSCPPNTSSRDLTGTVEINRELSRSLTVRVSYLYSQTQDLDIIAPLASAAGSPSLLQLTSTGGSHYHEIETTVHYRPTERVEANVSYVHSRGRGDLNTLASVFVPFEQPFIRPNSVGNFTSDVPNRVVGWGIFSLPWKLTLSPVVDVRTGFPYSVVDTYQNYVGVPNTQRFPTFFSLDARIYREFKFSSLPLMGRFKNQKVRFGVYSINLTNHLNYLDVYNNVASPQFGHFAGFQHRVDGLVIDLVD